ncbi:hypothetical protein [Dactylosporangium sp. CS-033363]|uniref:hypothetical protein n=1 Tax=Dactylosporangium sp. CS-033363 TaxID=3239935 RepID=UPI003D8E078A
MSVQAERRPRALGFALVGLAVVLGFGYLAWSNWSNDRALQVRGAEADARVVEVGKRATVEFRTADGRQVRALIAQGGSPRDRRPAVGDEIRVVYDPRHPEADVRDTRVAPNHVIALFMTATALVGAGAVAVAVVAELRRRVSRPA